MRTQLLLLLTITSLAFVSADYDPTEALECAYASSLAYCTPDIVQSWTCGTPCDNLAGYQHFYSNVFQVSKDETLSFSMIYNTNLKKVISTFRGTAGSYQLFMEILQGGASGYKLSSIPNAMADDYFYNHYVNNIRETFIPKLEEAAGYFPDFTYIFTGHSLGGALTTLAAFDAVTSGIVNSDQILMYTFGSPRVGNGVLAKAIESAVPEIYRLVHWNDLVPHVPPCIRNLKMQCVQGGLMDEIETVDSHTPPLLWHAWHVAQQVFYNEDSTSYTICSGEDPKCSDRFTLLNVSVDNHLHYLNMRLQCGGTSAFHFGPGEEEHVTKVNA
jgi:hypothetical protein